MPTVLFDAVEWNVLAHELPKISRRLVQKEGYTDLFNHQKELLRPFNILLETEVPKHFKIKNHPEAAEQVLFLYFAQLFSPHGMFLDLRPHHFDFHNHALLWHPSGLWTKLHPEFHKGLIDIYDGFYNDKEELYHNGLIRIGLASSDWPKEDIQQLAELFKAQFGSSLETEMKFELESFKSSLMKVMDFLLKRKVKVSPDFMYLGIYLVTMYASLEESGASVNVKQTYLDVRKAFT